MNDLNPGHTVAIGHASPTGTKFEIVQSGLPYPRAEQLAELVTGLTFAMPPLRGWEVTVLPDGAFSDAEEAEIVIGPHRHVGAAANTAGYVLLLLGITDTLQGKPAHIATTGNLEFTLEAVNDHDSHLLSA